MLGCICRAALDASPLLLWACLDPKSGRTQVWANCRLYNQDESDIVQLANDLARQFLAAWQSRGLPVAPTAAAPLPRPPSGPLAKPQLPAVQLTANGGALRASHRGRQAALMPQSQPISNGHQVQPAGQFAVVNGHAEHRGPHAAARSSKRSKQLASAGASIANGDSHQDPSKSHAHNDAKLLSEAGAISPSSAPVSAEGLPDAQRRPSIKITLRTASAVKSIVPVPQEQEPSRRNVTVKLRASSANNRGKPL